MVLNGIYRVQSVVPVPDTAEDISVDLQAADHFGGLTLTGVDLRQYRTELTPGQYLRVTIEPPEEPAPHGDL